MVTGSLLPGGSVQSAVRQFFDRGGFATGLQPRINGRVWYVDTINGSDGNTGRAPDQAFETMAEAFSRLDSLDWVIFTGDVREQLVTPADVYDVTILGAANTPRQATSGGVPTGGGSTWRGPASPTATTPLLEIKSAGWRIVNVEFTPVASSAAIRLTRSAVTDTIDASHASIYGCLFGANGVTTPIGIEDNGGCSRVIIDDNRFEGLTTAIKGLNTAAAIPLGWIITNNLFLRNTNAIGMSLTQGLVQRNVINQAANDTNFKINLIAVSSQGSLNMVLENFFSDAAANVTIAKGYKPGTTDVWRNYVTDTAAFIVAVPA